MYEPSLAEIKDRYYRNFRGLGEDAKIPTPGQPGSSDAHTLQFD